MGFRIGISVNEDVGFNTLGSRINPTGDVMMVFLLDLVWST